MKTCSKCKTEKPESDYFVKDKSTGRLHTQCKSCYKAHRKSYQREHYIKYRAEYLLRASTRREKLRKEFRDNILLYLDNKVCAECGESDIRTFEFAHIDSTTKTFNISQAVRLGRSWEEVAQEIKKCRVLCANCHKKETAEQFGWYKN